MMLRKNLCLNAFYTNINWLAKAINLKSEKVIHPVRKYNATYR